MIVYFHGFNSLPSENDLDWLKNNFPNEEIYAPFINYVSVHSFNLAIKKIKQRLALENDVFFIAKSLGCIMIEIIAGNFDNAVMINPGYGFKSVLDKYKKESFLKNFRDEKLIIKVDSDFLENIDSKLRNKPYGVALLANNDEILDMSYVEKECSKHYEIKRFEGGHSVELPAIPNLKEVIEKANNYIGFMDL